MSKAGHRCSKNSQNQGYEQYEIIFLALCVGVCECCTYAKCQNRTSNVIIIEGASDRFVLFTNYFVLPAPATFKMLVREAKVCLITGLSTLFLLILSVPHTLFGTVPDSWRISVFIGPVLYYVLLNMILKLLLKRDDFEVSYVLHN